MSNVITHVLELDLYTTTSYPVIKAQQYDYQTRFLKVVLKDHEEQYTIPTGASITLEGVRPSDNQSMESVFIISPTSIEQPDTVVFDITQALFNAGIVEAKVFIRWNNENELSSIPLYIDVYEQASHGISPTEEEKSIIDLMIEHMNIIDIHRKIDYSSTEPNDHRNDDIWLQEYS